MKKLFFLATAVLVCAGMWASEKFPTTIAPLDVDAVATAGEYVFTCSSANITAEADKASGWIGWTSTQSSYKDYDKSGSATCMGTQTKIPNLKYDAVTFYVQNCSGFCMHAWANGSSRSVTLTYAEYPDGTETVKSFTEASNTDCAHSDTIALDATKTYYIKASNGNSEEIGITYLYLFGPTCTSPATPLSITSDAPATLYEGSTIHLTLAGGNGAAKHLQLDGVDFEYLTWMAEAGEHTFTVSQEAYDGYCAQEAELKLNVLAATPVSAVTIDGPTSAFTGAELTYTATAANATAYEWYLDDVKQGSDSAKFIYTAVKGNHTIVCKARNGFNAEDEWIASDPIALKVTSLYGEIIKATLTSGSAATVTGLVGGTADVSLSSSKKMDKGKYFGITLASGAFQEGDTVVIVMATAGSNYPCLFGDKAKTKLLYLATETSSALEYKIVLPAEANGLTSLYLVRDGDDATYKWNPVLSSIAVIRPVAVDHADVSLVGAAINGIALSEEDLTTLLTANELNIATSYVNAPVVAFVKHTDTYYEGETEPVSTNDSIKVTATEVEGKWQAQATIGTETYTITLAKTASFTVHYMDGETELGTENVAANGTVANYAQYQSKSLYSFAGWYQDVDLTIEAVLTAKITTETYLYAKFEEKFAESINIEQLVLDNSKSYDLLNALGTNGYATNWTNDLDSLDNEKAQRNYPYLGEKVKAAGKMIDFRLAQGSTVKVKFGNAPADIKVVINGVENTVEAAALANPYEYTAAEKTYISIRSTASSTLVFKQIMINEAIQTVVLPALYTVTYNAGDGTCTVEKAETQFAGDKVVLPAVNPAENYEFDGWYDADTDGTKVGKAGTEYVPTANITLYAHYTPAGGGSAINNTDAAVQTVKVIRNGQLIIIRDGKEFNVLGTAVK